MAKKCNEFWLKFQLFLEEEIPNEIINILTSSGFDNILALSELTKEDISDIEKCCDKILLPGHRKFIIALGKRAKDFESSLGNIKKKGKVDISATSFILQELLKTAAQNANVNPKQHRYSEVIQWFATYVFLIGGRSAYEFLASNLPLPSVSTVLSYIHNRKQKIVEGELRCAQLLAYLDEIKAPRKVWLSEDASGIVAQVTYDPATNQLIGLVLPKDKNGMPMTFNFVPNSVSDINDQMTKNARSTLVYIVLAQPMKDNVSPFILQIYGEDNKFKSNDVLQRWNHTRDQLMRYGIEVIGHSSDGDPRLLSCMKLSTKAMMNQPSENVLMNLNREQSTSYVQDIIHFGTKMRNRILKFSIMLPMGKKVVSVSHLKMLLSNAPKEIHGIVASDISPDDRQNFASFEKISENRVLEALEKYIPDSEATIIYLKLSRAVVDAYNDVNLSPLERVSRIFHALYFFRAWRKWIKSQKNNNGDLLYNIEENFITQNAFDCLELNAYSMLHLISKLRESNDSDLFLPGIFNSQGCESTFRHFRTMSTANYTKINFTLHELLHMVGRVELKSEIEHSKLHCLVNFPRLKKPEKHKFFTMPSNIEIQNILEKSYEAALLDAAKVEMDINSNIRSCELIRGNIHCQKQQLKESIAIEEEEDFILDCSYFRDFSCQTSMNSTGINENTPFVEIMDQDGSSSIIKKSAIVWLLSESKGKLSSDRLKRVQARKEDESNGPKRVYKPPSFSNNIKMGNLSKLSEIKVGDWCIFKTRCENLSEDPSADLIIGNILAFKYSTGDTEKKRQYSLDVAPVKSNIENPRGISVLGLWYSLKKDFTLENLPHPSFFINIDKYVATVNAPEIDSANKKKVIGNVSEMKISLSLLLSQ